MPADRARVGKAVAGLIAAGLALRLAIASRPLDLVDRLFLPDDTYYILAIARSLAAGLGPTVDGTVLTSGFQPLWVFLLTPLFWLTADPDLPVRAAIVGAALCSTANVGLLARLAGRLAGPAAAGLAAALWAFSPVAVGNALGGMETSLAVTMVLLFLHSWCRVEEATAGTGTAAAVPRRRLLATGALAGGVVLARVDGALLMLLFAATCLARRQLRRLLVVAATAVVVVAPWWLYSLRQFGSVVPESGAASVAVVAYHKAQYLTPAGQVGWSAGTLLASPWAEPDGLRRALFTAPAAAAVGTGVALALAATAAWIFAVRRLHQAPLRWPYVAWAGFVLGVVLFYTFRLPALWFLRRYFHPCHAFLAVAIAALLGAVWSHPRALLRWPARVLAGATLTASLWQAAPWLWVTPEVTPNVGLTGAKGYREAARDVLAAVPADAVLGAFQSGALSYYAGEGQQVVNLDGVVDGGAARAVRERDVAGYARSRGVRYLADWPFNYQWLRTVGGPELSRARMRTIAQARPQGPADRFIVVAVDWAP